MPHPLPRCCLDEIQISIPVNALKVKSPTQRAGCRDNCSAPPARLSQGLDISQIPSYDLRTGTLQH